MTAQEIDEKLEEIIETDLEIEKFYDHFIQELWKNKQPLDIALRNGDVSLKRLYQLKLKEDDLYQEFFPEDISYLLEKIGPDKIGNSSIIIPTYQKLTKERLEEEVIPSRIRSYLEVVDSDSKPIERAMDWGSMRIAPYYFSHIYYQNPSFLMRMIQEEYLEIVASFLQINIDQSIKIENSNIYFLLLFQKSLFMRNPFLESRFVEQLFVYDHSIELNDMYDLDIMGLSRNAYSYFNEEFMKEQGAFSIAAIMTNTNFGFNYALDLLYLQSAISLAREEDSITQLERIYEESYLSCLDKFPYGKKKDETIRTIFQEKDGIRAGFQYTKKDEFLG